ncbi:peptidoglycan DD-metalloendopeptidase family protein [Catenovulum maritimum]|uniref:Peptidase M23 n=1 Tax=Catenovulum maritimum TaxID=1513271 RepID=A0A0J8JMR3_9ALTE|nr:peptidoglycan DD-metalloendopeptidase family protein [Catenovulum maritimum]KMT65901.1 peptidase M23 [Catenovulum maritimum]
MQKVSGYWNEFPKLHKISIVSIVAILTLFLILPSDDANASKQSDATPFQLTPGVRLSVDLSAQQVEIVEPTTNENEPASAPVVETPAPKFSEIKTEPELASVAEVEAVQYQWKKVKVLKNDSLANIFERNKISAKTLLAVSNSGKPATEMIKRLRPGQIIELGFLDNSLAKINYPISKTHSIEVSKIDQGFVANELHKPVESRNHVAAAIIKSNFWNAGLQAGLNDTQIMNLANIFGWDIDFALDIRNGDSFSVVYEELYAEGEHVGFGNILAAEFTNNGDTFIAIRHTDGQYYTPEGRSMRKAFLRAPVNFKYISSSFNPRRLHPVTGRVSAHRGIDYAARTGTPVVSAGDGKVIKSGRNSLNGNYVFIQHGKEYVTKYLHLHRRYVKAGQKVKQNQKIGTVGATGRVTGAHLHYEFLVNGVHRNPKTVKLPKAQPLNSSEKAEFMQTAQLMLDTLDTNKRVILAIND